MVRGIPTMMKQNANAHRGSLRSVALSRGSDSSRLPINGGVVASFNLPVNHHDACHPSSAWPPLFSILGPQFKF